MSVDQWLPNLRPALERGCAEFSVPLGVPVGWIQVESGGRIGEVTELDERGFFQLLPDESADLGLDHQRLSYDVEYSVRGGFLLIDRYRRILRNFTVQLQPLLLNGSEFQWRLVKFCHGIGPGAARTISREASAANLFDTWPNFFAYCQRNDAMYLQRLKHSPFKWCSQIDKMFDIGRPYQIDSATGLVC